MRRKHHNMARPTPRNPRFPRGQVRRLRSKPHEPRVLGEMECNRRRGEPEPQVEDLLGPSGGFCLLQGELLVLVAGGSDVLGDKKPQRDSDDDGSEQHGAALGGAVGGGGDGQGEERRSGELQREDVIVGHVQVRRVVDETCLHEGVL